MRVKGMSGDARVTVNSHPADGVCAGADGLCAGADGVCAAADGLCAGRDFIYPITNDAPVQLLVRVHLEKANAGYGERSEPALVTVNP